MSAPLSARGDGEAQRRAMTTVLKRSGMGLEQVWLHYFSLGGDVGMLEVEAFLQGLVVLPALQRDILALAANERLEEMAGALRVPYSRALRDPRPHEGPLAALATLIEQAPTALGGDLPAVAAEAGRALGVQLTIFVVDYEQTRLVPLTAPGAPPREAVSVEATLAGRAFRQVETQTAPWGPDPRLWVPMMDGSERLGVLEVVLGGEDDARDPLLRQQCGWVASLLGHLVVGAAEHGDAIETARRSRPRTPAAELLWQLLPPLTAAKDHFVLSGLLEPAYEVGGDVFDYALASEHVDLAIFDAMGHSLGAGLIATAGLAAYRSARRAGHGLHAQAAAVDDALGEHFPDALATGVLATLDLGTGRLRYVAAGHPAPLVLREGKVVTSLDGGRRTPFGLSTGELTLGETTLQPGDWIALYTDGVVEARDEDGQMFGEARLIDFLERQAASRQPPPETVRRLVRAVLEHQNGVLQDDATILLASWAADERLAPAHGPV